jgi:hypothetical protein
VNPPNIAALNQWVSLHRARPKEAAGDAYNQVLNRQVRRVDKNKPPPPKNNLASVELPKRFYRTPLRTMIVASRDILLSLSCKQILDLVLYYLVAVITKDKACIGCL